MSGKKETTHFMSPLSSSPSITKTEEEPPEEACRRKQLDDNMKRLQSLLFGADIAIEKGDFVTAQTLCLRLLGFLDSQPRTDVDETYIRLIRRDVALKIDTARRALAAESDRRAFEQVGQAPGHVFRKRGDFDVEKIRNFKDFRALLPKIKETDDDDRRNKHDKQEKLKGSPRANINVYNCASSSKECLVIENSQSLPSHSKCHSLRVDQEEERANGNYSRPKRSDMEICSPKNEIMKSPLCNDNETNNDAVPNHFTSSLRKPNLSDDTLVSSKNYYYSDDTFMEDCDMDPDMDSDDSDDGVFIDLYRGDGVRFVGDIDMDAFEALEKEVMASYLQHQEQKRQWRQRGSDTQLC